MRPVLPVDPLDVDQAQVRLVHQRRRLKAVTDALSSHASPRDPVKLSFEHRDEPRQRLVVATAPRQEKGRYIGMRSSNARIRRLFLLFLGF
jgi:hypothetical protein